MPPYKFPPELRALLDQVEVANKAHRASTRRRTSERYAERTPLRTRVELLKMQLKQTQQRRAAMVAFCWPCVDDVSVGRVHRASWGANTARLARLTTDLATATAALEAFDAQESPP